MIKKLLPIILISITTLAIVIALVILTNGNKTKTSLNAPQEKEQSVIDSTVLLNAGRLSDILLTEQFTAVRDELISYSRTKIGPKVTEIKITAEPKVNNDGSITFSASTTNPNQTFVVKLVRMQNADIVFSIPATNYTKTINVFASGPID